PPTRVLPSPPALLSPLLCSLALGDVDHHATQPSWAVAFEHHGYQVTQPHHTAVGGHHAVLEIVVPLATCRLLEEWHRPLAIFRVKVILPERRVGEPASHRVAQDALGLVAHERELKGR